MTESNFETLSAARDAAWIGDHEQAISLCTQGLAGLLDPGLWIAFYDTRAEELCGAGAAGSGGAGCGGDVRQSPRGRSNPAFSAQALNRQALVQMRKGCLETATAQRAGRPAGCPSQSE